MKILITIGVAAACLVIGVTHWQLSRLAPRWPGAIVPALWVGVAVYLVATGTIDSIVDVGGMLVVTVVLARIWDDGRKKHAAAAARPAPAQAEAEV